MQKPSYVSTTNLSSMCRFEKINAKLFILFMPFKMFAPLQFLSGLTFGLASLASFLFCVIGLVCILCRGRIVFHMNQGTRLLKRFAIMYVICDVTSIIMALFLHGEVGTIAGESTYNATFKKVLYSFAYILYVYYGSEVWKLLSKSDVDRTITLGIDVSIVIGTLGILVSFGIGPAIKLHNMINTWFNAWSADLTLRTGRVALLVNEPAYSASYLAAFAIPFVLSKIIQNGIKTKSIVRLLFCMIIMYYTKSTTGYVLVLADLLVFLLVYLRKGHKDFFVRLFSIVGVLLVVVSIGVIISRFGVSDTIANVFDKLINEDNMNSTDRKAMVAVDFAILKKYPVFGVGNGNQGFFYRQLIPKWMLSSYTAQGAYNRAKDVLFDGGPFWMAFISGYGMTGVLLLVGFFIASVKIMNKYRDIAGNLYYLYLMSIPVILVNGVAATMGGTYFMWLILSLPMSLPSMKNDVPYFPEKMAEPRG